MLTTMVGDFKRISRSRGRQQASQSQSQINISHVAARSAANLSQADLNMSVPSHMLDQTVCKAIRKDRSVHDLNKTNDSGQMTVEKKRVRKQVIAILSEVLDHRQASVKQQIVKKLCANQKGQDPFGQMNLSKGLVPALKPMSLHQQVIKLTASEKLLSRLPQEDQLRSVSAYLLCLTYF